MELVTFALSEVDADNEFVVVLDVDVSTVFEEFTILDIVSVDELTVVLAE